LVIAPADVSGLQIAAAMTTHGGVGTDVWPFDGGGIKAGGIDGDGLDVEAPAWLQERQPVTT
jgi:hypothetical protein